MRDGGGGESATEYLGCLLLLLWHYLSSHPFAQDPVSAGADLCPLPAVPCEGSCLPSPRKPMYVSLPLRAQRLQWHFSYPFLVFMCPAPPHCFQGKSLSHTIPTSIFLNLQQMTKLCLSKRVSGSRCRAGLLRMSLYHTWAHCVLPLPASELVPFPEHKIKEKVRVAGRCVAQTVVGQPLSPAAAGDALALSQHPFPALEGPPPSFATVLHHALLEQGAGVTPGQCSLQTPSAVPLRRRCQNGFCSR